ncbi:12945_t:CDS:2, partial [Rhizophagus irregularis]
MTGTSPTTSRHHKSEGRDPKKKTSFLQSPSDTITIERRKGTTFLSAQVRDYKDANNSQIKNPLKIDEKYGFLIVLKSLNDSSNINEDFLNEWKLHLQCQHEKYLF